MFVDLVVGWLRRRGWVCVPPAGVPDLAGQVLTGPNTVHGPWPPPGPYC